MRRPSSTEPFDISNDRRPPTGLKARRYVAVGDSITEGVGDPASSGDRGWSDRLAAMLDSREPGLLYANLAVTGARLAQIRDQQLPAALELEPDLVSVFGGVNDVLRPRFNSDEALSHLADVFTASRAKGATVLSATLPELSTTWAFARAIRSRVLTFNAGLRTLAAEHDVALLDLALEAVTVDPQLWCADRLHPNSEGHTRMALGAAHLLAVSDDVGWREPPPGEAERSGAVALARAEARWVATHLGPWTARRILGRRSSDGRRAKRPTLAPVR